MTTTTKRSQMFKQLFCSLILIGSTALAGEITLPHMIDFRTYNRSQIPGYDAWDLGDLSSKNFTPFNGALELGPFFAYLSDTYNIDVAIETGSGSASSTKFLALVFEDVHTIEIDVSEYRRTVENLLPFPNAVAYHGNSPDFLRLILPQYIGQRVFFYLDAHWGSDWPLLKELEMISRTHRDNCIIIIDDFKVPGRSDIPFDAYNNEECSYEYIQKQLDKVYSSYSYYYLIPSDTACRAKFVAIPTNWQRD